MTTPGLDLEGGGRERYSILEKGVFVERRGRKESQQQQLMRIIESRER